MSTTRTRRAERRDKGRRLAFYADIIRAANDAAERTASPVSHAARTDHTNKGN